MTGEQMPGREKAGAPGGRPRRRRRSREEVGETLIDGVLREIAGLACSTGTA